MAIDTALRFIHYTQRRSIEVALPLFESLDAYLQKPEAKILRVALASIFYFGSLLVATTLSWKWIAIFYSVQTLLDMYLPSKKSTQRWDELIDSGLSLGLAIRASIFILGGLYRKSILETAKGVFLAGSLFFKQDLDQYDWVAYAQPLQASLIRSLSSVREALSTSGRRRELTIEPADIVSPIVARRLFFLGESSSTPPSRSQVAVTSLSPPFSTERVARDSEDEEKGAHDSEDELIVK